MQNFISFEGIDGSGKTTQSRMLCEALIKNGHKALWTREIGGTQVAESLREIILHDDSLSARTELLMLMAARSEHIEKVIAPALEAGQLVICDRFIESTAAYQGQALGVDFVYAQHEMMFPAFLPQLTFFIDIDPQLAADRANERGDITKFERRKIEFSQKLRDVFLSIAEQYPERIKVIDGNRELQQIHQDIYNIIDQTAPSKSH